MVRKITNRQIQALNTKDKIYRVSIDLIEKKGFQNVTVKEICKAANVSIGSFYNCFSSKNDILNTIFKLADDYFLNFVAPNIKNGSAKSRIIRFFTYYADYNVERGLSFIQQLYTVRNNLFATKGRYLQTLLREIIEEGQKNGEISTDMTAEEAVRFLFIAVRGVVYDWCLHNGEYNLTEAVTDYVERLVKIL